MPAITPNSTVLVTGANGYIGLWIVKFLLEKGYTARAAVRERRGEVLKDLFGSYGDKLEIVYVNDIQKEGAFDEAIKGVEGILHTACPVDPMASGGLDYFVDPAVNGTLSIMNSAAKTKNVKRLVFTSSCVTITGMPSDQVFDESDWNEGCVQMVKEQGDDAIGPIKYCAAKTISEKAAWDFYNKNKTSLSWELTALVPPMIHGPPLAPLDSPEKLGYSMSEWYSIFFKDLQPYSLGHATIDVRDAALTHILALEKEQAGGERIITSGGSFLWTEFFEAANAISPPIYDRVFVNDKIVSVGDKYPLLFSNAKSDTLLGYTYRTRVDTTKAILEDFKRRGW